MAIVVVPPPLALPLMMAKGVSVEGSSVVPGLSERSCPAGQSGANSQDVACPQGTRGRVCGCPRQHRPHLQPNKLKGLGRGPEPQDDPCPASPDFSPVRPCTEEPAML